MDDQLIGQRGWSMTSNGQQGGSPPPVHGQVHGQVYGRCSADGTPGISEIVRHLVQALTRHVRQLHQEGLPVPREVEELTVLLMHLVRIRQDLPAPGGESGTAQYARMPDRLLVTKSEAAERLGVSVRTIERLVATGQLAQVHVERLARFRLSDLESYVNSLAQNPTSQSDSGTSDDQR